MNTTTKEIVKTAGAVPAVIEYRLSEDVKSALGVEALDLNTLARSMDAYEAIRFHKELIWTALSDGAAPFINIYRNAIDLKSPIAAKMEKFAQNHVNSRHGKFALDGGLTKLSFAKNTCSLKQVSLSVLNTQNAQEDIADIIPKLTLMIDRLDNPDLARQFAIVGTAKHKSEKDALSKRNALNDLFTKASDGLIDAYLNPALPAGDTAADTEN